MAIKAVAVDDENTQHLIIGLNRNNVNDLLDGDVFTLPQRAAISLTEKATKTLRNVFPRGSGLFNVSWTRFATVLRHRCR